MVVTWSLGRRLFSRSNALSRDIDIGGGCLASGDALAPLVEAGSTASATVDPARTIVGSARTIVGSAAFVSWENVSSSYSISSSPAGGVFVPVPSSWLACRRFLTVAFQTHHKTSSHSWKMASKKPRFFKGF